jgi:hypothetical protein
MRKKDGNINKLKKRMFWGFFWGGDADWFYQ